MNWHDVWEGKRADRNTTLSLLMELNGHDSGAGAIMPKDWIEYVKSLKKIMGIKRGDSVFEVGCGAGAFLYSLNHFGIIGGCDYSSSQIETAQHIFPHGNFVHMDAEDIDTEQKYDYVVTNSVLHYLDIDKAERVFNKMLQKAKKAVGIFDIPDIKYQQQTEWLRSQTIRDYEERYRSLQHTYFSKDIFEAFDKAYVQGAPSMEGKNRFGVIIWV